FTSLRVRDRCSEQLRELGETVSGVLGQPLRVGCDDGSPNAAGHQDRDTDARAQAAATDAVGDFAVELRVVVDACRFGMVAYEPEYARLLERYARPGEEKQTLCRKRAAHSRHGVGLVAGDGDRRRIDHPPDLLGDNGKE